jgi:hypothetical protein
MLVREIARGIALTHLINAQNVPWSENLRYVCTS